jgi:hypothetical protein
MCFFSSPTTAEGHVELVHAFSFPWTEKSDLYSLDQGQSLALVQFSTGTICIILFTICTYSSAVIGTYCKELRCNNYSYSLFFT